MPWAGLYSWPIIIHTCLQGLELKFAWHQNEPNTQMGQWFVIDNVDEAGDVLREGGGVI
jgi:hypothetical protein